MSARPGVVYGPTGEPLTRDPQPGQLVVLPPRASLTDELVDEATEQRRILGRYVEKNMVEGTDFGLIPGTSDEKRTLFKAGAEKLLDLFGCNPEYSFERNEENFEKGFVNYQMRCVVVLRSTGKKLAEGVGSCNSYEPKYRWRLAELRCPYCQQTTVRNSSREPGYYCWRKVGGCGATFDLNDPQIARQPRGRVLNEDVAGIANTILKMAKKRAMIDAVIALARCSDLFTQDLEERAEEEDDDRRRDGGQQQERRQPPRQQQRRGNRLDEFAAGATGYADDPGIGSREPPKGGQRPVQDAEFTEVAPAADMPLFDVDLTLVRVSGVRSRIPRPSDFLAEWAKERAIPNLTEDDIADLWDRHNDSMQAIYEAGDDRTRKYIDRLYSEVQACHPRSTPPRLPNRRNAR